MLLAFILGWIYFFPQAVSAAILQSISALTLKVPPRNSTFVESFANAAGSSTKNASLLNATTIGNIRCHGIRYGFNPNVDDCMSAIRHIGRGWQIVSFADRKHLPNPEAFPLPYRLMGGEQPQVLMHSHDRLAYTKHSLWLKPR